MTFNTWPLMDGALAPAGLFIQSPWWINLFENVATVQFNHRIIAYILLAVVFGHALQAWRTEFSGPANAMVFLTVVQAVLGIITLVFGVPKPIALLHQFGATLLLIVSVLHVRSMRPPMPIEAAEGR
jgi:cytochrome c oxidase assembly protein subunit 15